MKLLKIALLFLTFIESFHPYLYADQNNRVHQLSDELQIRPIVKNSFLVTHSFPWPANSLLVRYPGRYIIWVDTPYTDSGTEQVWKWIKSDIGSEKIIEINTGFHNDNLGGNGFLYTKSIDVYGSSLTVQLLKDCSEKTKAQILDWLKKPKFEKYYIAHSQAEYMPPNNVFDIAPDEVLNLLDGLIEIYYPGPSHSKDNLMVYFPDKKLLFGGCPVKSVLSKGLGFTGDADMLEWPKSLKRILSRYKDAVIVVPGHGEVGGLDLIKHTLSLF
jgi:glyoxylase-like metal-dependent hydrolase (beta-lactamase superfamily II)